MLDNMPSPNPFRKREGNGLDSGRDSQETATMTARIFQHPKNAMQSGKALIDQWILEFVPAEAKRADPLMGWAGSGDMKQQLRLVFATREDAQAYADRYGIDTRVLPTPPRRLKIQAYADNFR
jgi:hypothetical protein